MSCGTEFTFTFLFEISHLVAHKEFLERKDSAEHVDHPRQEAILNDY